MHRILLTTLLALQTIAAIAQARTEPAERAPQPTGSFQDYQATLDQWLRDPAHRAQKGWKTLKRWEDQEARHMNPDGSSADPAELTRTLQHLADAKAHAAASKTTGGGWLPYGPNDYADPVDPYWIPGIGRINCIAFHPTNALIFWVGVAQGGVWRTNDGGTSWTPLTDDLPMLRVSDIAVHPTNPDILYISTGDYAYLGAGLSLDNRKRHSHYGLGVYKTTNGGLTWAPTGLARALTDVDWSLTRRTFIHPVNPDILLAVGTYGTYRSADAGATWTQIDPDFIWDIEQDPSNPYVLYASTGYRSTLNTGQAGIRKSIDFGLSWTTLNTGIPATGVVQRIELSVARSNNSYVYALCAGMDAGYAGIYRTTNDGITWENRSIAPNILEWGDGSGFGGQGWYDLAILVNPYNPDIVYTGGINVWGSTDGGQTFNPVTYWLADYGPSIHADQHQFAWNPLNGKYYVCNDGGLYSTDSIFIGSWDDAQTIPGYNWPTLWTPLSSGMQTTSFYRVGSSHSAPGHVIAGAQDNSTYYFNGFSWANVIGGDGMDCFIDPTNDQYLYGSSQYGNLVNSTDGGFSWNWLSTMPEQGEWTTPWMLDPQDPSVIYAAMGQLWRTSDMGITWNAVSAFPINSISGQSNVASALAVSPSNPSHIYLSKRYHYTYGEPSVFWSTTDGGLSWNQRSMGVPDSLYHTMIAAHGSEPLTAFVTLGGYLPGQKVMKTTDGGATWSNHSAGLPNLPANCIVHDSASPHNTLYVGMDVGVYYRNDTMSAWQPYVTDLPNVIVSDLDIHQPSRKIYAATFGRGIWQADLLDIIGTGIHAPDLAGISLRVSPVPSSGPIQLDIQDAPMLSAQLSVIDVMGRTLHQQAIDLSQQRHTLRLDLPDGIYHLRIDAGGRAATRKFLIQR